jgi:hypothetical protein
MLFIAFVILSTAYQGNRQYEKLDITRSANYIKEAFSLVPTAGSTSPKDSGAFPLTPNEH